MAELEFYKNFSCFLFVCLFVCLFPYKEKLLILEHGILHIFNGKLWTYFLKIFTYTQNLSMF